MKDTCDCWVVRVQTGGTKRAEDSKWQHACVWKNSKEVSVVGAERVRESTVEEFREAEGVLDRSHEASSADHARNFDFYSK